MTMKCQMKSSLDGSVCPSGCLPSVRPSSRRNICPVVRPSINTLLSLALNACPSLLTYLPTSLSVRPSIHTSIYPFHVPMHLYDTTYQWDSPPPVFMLLHIVNEHLIELIWMEDGPVARPLPTHVHSSHKYVLTPRCQRSPLFSYRYTCRTKCEYRSDVWI